MGLTDKEEVAILEDVKDMSPLLILLPGFGVEQALGIPKTATIIAVVRKKLCDDILPISPKIALVHTGVLADTWQGILSDLMCNSPTSCILKLRWRPSFHGSPDVGGEDAGKHPPPGALPGHREGFRKHHIPPR